mmetsp:Transcript_924/g.2741  ORF Transcript_924/g.2741 Transcript_924/m.2741 type:complete len:255 (+) Transcript_924:786-1550(+)
MVYRDSCLDKIRDWDRNRRSVDTLARKEAIIASIIQSASACDIESVAVEAIPWVGRWALKDKRLRELRSSRGASVRIGHKRFLGIPLRLYTDLEARLTLDKTNKPELVSIGPNFTVPRTRGCLALNISSTSKCINLSPYLQPKTLDVSVKLKLCKCLRLEASCLLDQNAKYFPSPKDIKPCGAGASVRLDLAGLSAKGGFSVFGFHLAGGQKKQRMAKPKEKIDDSGRVGEPLQTTDSSGKRSARQKQSDMNPM